ncbi:uncharacterized protein M421DRAFT_100396 [Didymella exigua CBS 183.55]|uniref:HMG box domain-containing protein n=1 Tax=Didymella exigua CBS 183.55 TaxID=1150837 RepID=A0A6A5RLH1_9PLEO|nr:uncharacterized protein M421DRAFT_100396 [Didymella exigua CBS 183.55]KAF1929265.1 hypothetical protein M421DRAFT_100396 [Didymella exigua CBS 183.55]
MRFLPRLLHAGAAAAILIVLYFVWLQHDHLGHNIHEAWEGTAHRIVVFGDDWSDTGKYRVSPPSKAQAVIRDSDRGDVWTETLCKELACDFIDNFARSMAPHTDAATVGSLIDSDIRAQAVPVTDNNNNYTQAMFDFKTQVQQFLEYEKMKHRVGVPERLRKVDEWTIFTVSFGLWDLLEYSALEKEYALKAIDNSIEGLFENLDLLAKHVAAPMKIVAPKLIDVTFLPRFQSRRNMDKEHFAEDQHHLVFLWTYWNTALSRTASQWNHGEIFMPNPNNLITDQVRAKQLYSKNLSDASGMGKQAPLFDYVEEPCVRSTADVSAETLQAVGVEKCFDASKHLFWDDVHLSGPAHQLIGKAAASLLRGNHIVNVGAVAQGSNNGEKASGKETPSFKLNVPRRYVKSNMQVGDDSSHSLTEDANSGRSLRKSTRIQIPRSAPNISDVQHTKEEEQPTSTSPRVARKRTPSLDSDGNTEGSVKSEGTTDVKTPASAGSAGSGDRSPHVCLCQPEPKIPRPRNAFILYRQHHQQTIIRRNPGLNNPDISKIIGEKWKAESDEEKKIWQDLAQEEKARHHEQYPDYRYQPRRVNKPGSSSLNPGGQHTTVDKYRCPRCGGRSIKTPTSPYPTEDQGTPTLPPPNTSEGLTSTTRYLPMMGSLSLESPVVARRGPGPSRLSNIQVPPSIREQEMYSPLTPGQKRRRYDHVPPPSARRPEGPYYPQSAARRESLPPIHVHVSPPNTAGMHPPSARTPQDRRLPIHELPNRNGSSASDMNIVVPQHHDQSRSVEAMVLSVPYQARIKLLGRICAPLKEPGPTSPAMQTRGAIIAVEGDDMQAVQDLAQWLNECLSKDEEYHSRIVEPPKTPSDSKKEVTFEEYLELISVWHGKSKEMTRYITTPMTGVDAGGWRDEGMERGDDKDSATPPDSPRNSTTAPTKKPIIILPTFQLHASVAYASRIPIQDAYSPTDHWQWMATLWRGIVGPDLTLYVESYDVKESPAGKMVELDEQVRCLTVLKAQGARFADASLRRVGFEVSEWVRGLGRRDA